MTTVPIIIGTLSNYVSKNITEIDQNKLPWKPITSINDVSDEKDTVTKLERLPAESNLSFQSSLKPSGTEITERMMNVTTETNESNELKPSWIPAMINTEVTATEETRESDEDTIQPVDAAKSTGFESITKLPSGMTTPIDENIDNITDSSDIRTTTDFDITTIRFSYVPTEDLTKTEAPLTNNDWHRVAPTEAVPSTLDDGPITTYRPKFTTTTEIFEESTSIPIDTTPQLKISSQITEEATYGLSESLETSTSETVTTIQPTTTALPTATTTESEEAIIATTMRSELTTEKLTTTTNPLDTSEYSETFKTTEESVIQWQTESGSEENSHNNEVIYQDATEEPATPVSIPNITTTTESFRPNPTWIPSTTTTLEITTRDIVKDTVRPNSPKVTTDKNEETTAYTTETVTKSISELEDLTSYAEEVTTESSSRVLAEEAGSGAAIAIAVSTIGVIALVLLVGLLVSRKYSCLVFSVS